MGNLILSPGVTQRHDYMNMILNGADLVLALVTVGAAVFYTPFASSWRQGLLTVLIISVISSAAGLIAITILRDSSKNILACILFPLTSLIIASVARAIKLAFCSIFYIKR